jgi:hypothetical protein
MLNLDFKGKKRKKRIELLLTQVPGLPDRDRENANMFLENGEWGLALETLCGQLYENDVSISAAVYEGIRDAGTEMGMDDSTWTYLYELIEGPRPTTQPVQTNETRKEKLPPLKLTPDEYMALHTGSKEKELWAHNFPEYWEGMPEYTLAICPFCRKPYSERIDTYTLRLWEMTSKDGRYAFSENGKDYISRCRHFVAVQSFICLNGFKPAQTQFELPDMTIWLPSEQPHVMGVAFAGRSKAVAVMHSLPLCRIEEDKFVPRYTLYTISYFETWWKYSRAFLYRMTEQMGRMGSLLAYPEKPGQHDDWWDLKKWAKKRRLLWLSLYSKKHELDAEPFSRFPYENIAGRRFPYWDTAPITQAEYYARALEREKASQELKERAAKNRERKRRGEV